MDTVNLIRMANRIGDFFAVFPEHDVALEEIAHHLRAFWEPRMRGQLLEFLAAHPNGAHAEISLHPLVLNAVQRNRERLTPAPRAS